MAAPAQTADVAGASAAVSGGHAFQSRACFEVLVGQGSGVWLRAKLRRLMMITLNGEPRPMPAEQTIAALVAELALAGKRYAVERNGEIVPRGLHGETSLAPDDRIEIVVAVGGG